MMNMHRIAPGMTNAHSPFAGLATGGQPTPADLERLAAAGVKVVYDLREAHEPRGYDEAAACRTAGLQYINIPVGGGPLDESLFERMREVVRNTPQESALVHCVSGNRVGFALLPALILDRNLSADDALAIAARMGLRSPQLARFAMDYVARIRAEETTDVA